MQEVSVPVYPRMENPGYAHVWLCSTQHLIKSYAAARGTRLVIALTLDYVAYASESQRGVAMLV